LAKFNKPLAQPEKPLAQSNKTMSQHNKATAQAKETETKIKSKIAKQKLPYDWKKKGVVLCGKETIVHKQERHLVTLAKTYG
jgi:2-succinyl-5-enolpyruvyl-6-hydroxy-3-cyclohexene-1-carboxylate synthase